MSLTWLCLLLALNARAEEEAAPEGGEASEGSDASDAPPVEAPDRSAPPEVRPSPRLDLGEPEVHTLSPGVEVWYVPVEGVRRVAIQAVVGRGTHELVGWPTVAAQTMGRLMDVATERYPASVLSERADIYEIELHSWLGHHQGGVSLSVPAEALDEGLDLMAEVLRAPIYPKKDIRRSLRDQRIFYELTGPTSPRNLAYSALTYAWMPGDHPYGARPDLAALKRVNRKELGQLHADWVRAGPITLVVSGSLPWSALEGPLAQAVAGLGAPGLPGEALTVEPPAQTRVVAVDMPGQQQATVVVRMAAPAREDDDRVPFELANYALGGHFLSRLNANLREDKGFTYGTRSGYQPNRFRGHVTISVDVAADNVAAAITEIEHEIRTLATDGVTAEELDWAVRSRTFDWNETRRTADSARDFYVQRLTQREGVADAAAREDRAASLQPEEVTEVAARWLGEDQPKTWVIVGDRSLLADRLEGLGWTVEWIDPPAAMLGVF